MNNARGNHSASSSAAKSVPNSGRDECCKGHSSDKVPSMLPASGSTFPQHCRLNTSGRNRTHSLRLDPHGDADHKLASTTSVRPCYLAIR